MNKSNENKGFRDIILEKALDIIVIINREGNIQYANRKIPGIIINNSKGKKIYDFILPE